jgi:low temperature requirement protein LtrA
MAARPHANTVAITEDASVTSLELFFDLVFVFALTQVTALMAEDLTVRGMIRATLVVAVLWWAWVGWAWLGNLIKVDEGIARVIVFGAMIAMFLAALTIPEAFDDLPGGLSGPVVFAACYFLVRLAHYSLFWVSSRGDPGLRRQLLRFAPSVVIGTGMLLVASQLTGTAQTLMWLAALVGDYLGTTLGGARGWRVRSASHFAERHGLIIIVALGESIVSIGVGVTALPISWPIIAGSVLGLIVSATLWWAYFDVVALVAERVLTRARGEARARLARDSFSFLHLPMVLGIIFLSLGLKKVLAYVGGDEGHTLADPLYGIPLVSLFGGVSLYLLAHVGFRWRNVHTLNVHRIVVAVVLLALIPVMALVPALGSLAALAAIMVGLIAYEAIRFAEARDQVRHAEDDAIVDDGREHPA